MRLSLTLWACLLPAVVSAGEVELAGYIGQAVPFYDQTFRYDPGPLASRIPGLTVNEQGGFQLNAKGGIDFGGSLTWYALGPAGLEARIDTAGADVNTTGAQYQVSVRLPLGLPPLSSTVDLGTGTVSVDRLRPLSLNLKVRTPRPLRLVLSGGASYLPAFGFTVTETVGLGLTGLNILLGRIDVASLALRAAAPDEDHWGWNAGGGLQIKLGPKVALVAEARYFRFAKESLQWSRADARPLSALEEALLREVLRRLEPLAFAPTFFQVTGGIAVGF